jgi:nucleotidyltransferase/DNA polymerase involved in DNA repair
MDAFFVEVERLRRPELREKAVVVGGAGPRGVVASASYEARRFGVRSAMPTGQARRLCPQLQVVPADHREYAAASDRVFEIFRSFTPLVEGLSLDEAFLDISGLRHHYPDPVAVGHQIRREITSQVGLPASVGVASNKLLAKLASEAAKPDGLHHVPFDGQLAFLHALPVRSLWGVGEATHAALEAVGIATVADIAAIPESTLVRRLGAALGHHLALLATGRDERPVIADSEAKSVSVEQTFEEDLESEEQVRSQLFTLCERLSWRLRRAGLAGRTANLKVRYADFTTITRSLTMDTATKSGRDLHEAVTALTEKIDLTRPVRLLGVGCTALGSEGKPNQLSLDQPAKWEKMAEAVNEVRTMFGDSSVRPASLVSWGDEGHLPGSS